MLRTMATFSSGFADDCIEDGNEIIQRPWLEMTSELAARLRELDVQVSQPQVSEHGWLLEARLQGRLFLIEATLDDPNECYLFCDSASLPWKFWSAKGRSAHADLVRRIADIMDRDPRFRNVLWYRNAMAEHRGEEGARTPFT